MAEESYYGMQEIADSIGAVAKALHKLGLAEASTPFGAIEALMIAIEKAGEEIAGGLHAIAEAIEAHPRPVSDD